MTRFFILMVWIGAFAAMVDRVEQAVPDTWMLRSVAVPVIAAFGAPIAVGVSAINALPPMPGGQP